MAASHAGQGQAGTGLRQPPARPPARTPATALGPRLAAGRPVSPPRSCILFGLETPAWSVPGSRGVLSRAGAGLCSSPPRGPLRWLGLCPDPSAPVASPTRQACLWSSLETVRERCDKCHACFSPGGSTVTHAAAPLGRGFLSGCTQRGAGAQEAVRLCRKVS